ncbi:MAG: HPr family phosphocarrier protein [Lachnospiraceae bacterium]|jgi:phosphocarrier protein HPr
MKTFKYVITDPVGIHARPAGQLVAAAKKYASNVDIELNGKSASAKKLINLMSLGVKQGNEITVKVEGADEDTAAAELEAWLKANL